MSASHMKGCTCTNCERRRKARQEFFASVIVVVVLLACGLLFGCSSTVTPAPVESHQASFDQGEQNSGVLQMLQHGAVISAHARDRYNALIGIYGAQFIPALERDAGITARGDGTYFISNDALENFVLMNAWRRMGRAPGQPK